MGTIFTDGFEQARKQRRANDLKFESFRVCNFNGSSAIVFAVEPLKVFIV
jgi:hypothetical protein